MHRVLLDFYVPSPTGGGSSAGTGEVGDRFAHYRYDGQMNVETSIVRDNGPMLVRNGLGARSV